MRPLYQNISETPPSPETLDFSTRVDGGTRDLIGLSGNLHSLWPHNIRDPSHFFNNNKKDRPVTKLPPLQIYGTTPPPKNIIIEILMTPPIVFYFQNKSVEHSIPYASHVLNSSCGGNYPLIMKPAGCFLSGTLLSVTVSIGQCSHVTIGYNINQNWNYWRLFWFYQLVPIVSEQVIRLCQNLKYLSDSSRSHTALGLSINNISSILVIWDPHSL